MTTSFLATLPAQKLQFEKFAQNFQDLNREITVVKIFKTLIPVSRRLARPYMSGTIYAVKPSSCQAATNISKFFHYTTQPRKESNHIMPGIKTQD